jgi:hypothetical protein
MDDKQIRDILKNARVIATVGFSTNPDKPSSYVPEYLMYQGYRVIPVNPTTPEILGEKAYPDLLAIPEKVDVVQIFRPAEDVPAIVAQAIQIGAKVIWMQEGIVNEEAAKTAREAGLQVVMDKCMMKQHRRLLGAH